MSKTMRFLLLPVVVVALLKSDIGDFKTKWKNSSWKVLPHIWAIGKRVLLKEYGHG